MRLRDVEDADLDAFDAHWTKIRGMDSVLTRTILVGDAVAGHIASFSRDGDREVTPCGSTQA